MPRIRKRNRDRGKLGPHHRADPHHPAHSHGLADPHRPAAQPRWADGLSDVSIAGDPLAFPHLVPTAQAEHPTTVAGYARLVRRIAADRERWAPLVRYDALTRWYARLETGPGYEVWLLSWLPGQGADFHDHGRSAALMTVVQGELTERSLRGSGERDRTLRPGAQRVFAPGHLHEMVNTALEPAVSIHLYTPGLVEMNQYPREQARPRPEHVR